MCRDNVKARNSSGIDPGSAEPVMLSTSVTDLPSAAAVAAADSCRTSAKDDKVVGSTIDFES